MSGVPLYLGQMQDHPHALDRLDLCFRWGNYGIKVIKFHLAAFPPGKIVDYHHHSEYEFHYIPRGKGLVVLEGKSYSLREGMMYLTGPGVTHYQEADLEDPMEELCLHVDIVRLSDNTSDAKVDWGASWESAEADICMEELHKIPLFPVPDRYGAMDWFLTAHTAWKENRMGFYSIAKQSVIQILLQTIQAYVPELQQTELPERDMKWYRFQLAADFIQDNYRRPITLEGVAERVGISPRQLQRIFREKAKMTFSQYVEEYRLRCIREELVRSSKTLEQIALENGFATSNYLHYVFKKAYGVTPMQYRKYRENFLHN